MEHLTVQFGSKGPEIHPVSDENGEIVVADVNPDKAFCDEKAEVYAHCMAAAPALLEACEALAKQEDWEGEDISPDSPIGKAWAAIAKAKGD